MANEYDPMPELAGLFLEALQNGTGASAEYAGRIAENLGLGEDDNDAEVAGVLRKALGLPYCKCSIAGTGEVIPLARPVHGTPCDQCGGLESCRPGCDGTEAGSGFDADGTPWTLAVNGDGLVVSVGSEDVLLKGEQRDRFTEAVARTSMPGQVSGKRGNHGPGCQCTPCKAEPSYRTAQSAGTEG